jgi:hypothetical protein
MRCPENDAHEVTFVNGEPGIALTCHGPTGHGTGQPAGHSLAAHHETYRGWFDGIVYRRFDGIPFPCRFCGCLESMVLAAIGARRRDLYAQPEADSDGDCWRCGGAGYQVAGLPPLCLVHLAGEGGLDPAVLFASAPLGMAESKR